MCVVLRPAFLPKPASCQFVPPESIVPGFIVHPSTSEIAEQLMIDPESLSNENYSGIYDENGDYIPQYCDNPEDIPQSAPPISANKSDVPTPGATEANDAVSDSSSSLVGNVSPS